MPTKDTISLAILSAQNALQRRTGTSDGDVNALHQPIAVPRFVLEALLGVIAEQEAQLEQMRDVGRPTYGMPGSPW